MKLRFNGNKIDTNHMRQLPDWQKRVLKNVSVVKLVMSIFVFLYCVMSITKFIPFTLTTFLLVVIMYVLVPRVIEHFMIKKYKPKGDDTDSTAS